MPFKPLRYCAEPHCPAKTTETRCPQHTARLRTFRRQEGGHRLYRTIKWQRLRMEVLVEHPFCQRCHTALSTEVHHTVKHNGDEAVFLQREWLEAVCRSCHSQDTRRGL